MRVRECESLSEDDATFGEVIRTEFDSDLVAGQDSDKELSHLAAHVCKDLLIVFEFDPELCVRQGLGDFRFKCDLLFFSHSRLLMSP